MIGYCSYKDNAYVKYMVLLSIIVVVINFIVPFIWFANVKNSAKYYYDVSISVGGYLHFVLSALIIGGFGYYLKLNYQIKSKQDKPTKQNEQ